MSSGGSQGSPRQGKPPRLGSWRALLGSLLRQGPARMSRLQITTPGHPGPSRGAGMEAVALGVPTELCTEGPCSTQGTRGPAPRGGRSLAGWVWGAAAAALPVGDGLAACRTLSHSRAVPRAALLGRPFQTQPHGCPSSGPCPQTLSSAPFQVWELSIHPGSRSCPGWGRWQDGIPQCRGARPSAPKPCGLSPPSTGEFCSQEWKLCRFSSSWACGHLISLPLLASS